MTGLRRMKNVKLLAFWLAVASLGLLASTGAAEQMEPVRVSHADLIAQPWKYHGKTVRVSGVLRYVFAGRGSRMNLGADRGPTGLIGIDAGDDEQAIWLPLYRYQWADVELTAVFDGECKIPRADEKITICADGGISLSPRAVTVRRYVEPVIESRSTVELREMNLRSKDSEGIVAFVHSLVRAISQRDVTALEAMDLPRVEPISPKVAARQRVLMEDLFFASDMRIFNPQSPEPSRDYRFYRESGYPHASARSDYLCFCKQASCEARWPRPGEIFNANPTRPWVCYSVMRQRGRWYFG